MKKYLKNQNEKGITLLILVVTIVVILILAAITVDLSFNENGVIKQALGLQDKIDTSINQKEDRLNELQQEILNGTYGFGMGGVVPDSNSTVEGGDGETGGDASTKPSAPKVEVTGTQGEVGYYNGETIVTITANNSGNNLTYTVAGTGIDQGSVSTETPIGNGQGVAVNKDGAYTITAYEYNTYGQKSEGTTVTVIRDTVAPTGTLQVTNMEDSGITVQIVAIDPEPSSGLASDYPYTFYYKEEGATEWKNAGKGNTSSYTYAGLNLNNLYTFKAEITDKAGNIGTSNETENIKDTTPPVIHDYRVTGTTTDTITVEVQAEDEGRGIKTEGGYTYYISTDETFPEDSTTIMTTNNPTYTFTGLEDETTYYTQVEVTDNSQNSSMSQTISAITGTMPSGIGNITVSNMTWNGDGSTEKQGTAKITVTNNQTSYNMQYQVLADGTTPTEENWIDVEQSSTEVNGLHHNDKIYARLVDKAGNTGSMTTIDILDEENPTAGSLNMKQNNSTGAAYENDTWTNQNVYIEIQNGTDSESGHKTTIAKDNTETLTNPDTLDTDGTHTIVVTTTDWAGNTASNVYTVKIDQTAPTITNTSTPNPSLIEQGETSTITITTSEPITITNPNNITVTGEGSEGATVNVQVSEDGTTITITVTGGTDNGPVQVHIPEGTMVDKAGNTMPEQNIGGITVNNTRITSVSKHTDANGENYNYGDWTHTDIYTSITAETAKNIDKYQYSTDSGNTWQDIGTGDITFNNYTKTGNNATFLFTQDMEVNIQYRGVMEDATYSDPTQEYTIKIDKTAPTVTNTTTPSVDLIKQGDTANITITTNEAVTITNPDNITVTGDGSQGATVTAQVDNNGTTITITVTGGTGTGDIQVNIPEGTMVDKAGNSLPTQTLTGIQVDNTAPTVTEQQGPNPVTIAEGTTSTTTLVFSEPIIAQNTENITVTGAGSQGCTVQTTVSADGTSMTITVTGGTGLGDIEINLPEGIITDRVGHTMPSYTITGINVDEIGPQVTLKYNDSTGETYTPGTWTNQNVYTEVTIPSDKTVDKYQYSYDGNDWYDIATELATVLLNYTMTFPTDSTKPEFIGDLTASNATYYFKENGSGGIVSNNKGVHSTTASSYIPINLQSFSTEDVLNITINATTSGESSYDYGFAVVTESTDIPSSSHSSRFLYGTGSVTTKNYPTTLTGGKLYYLHIGYRKDGSSSSYNDEMVINSITFQSDSIGKGIQFYNYTKTNNKITYTLQDEIVNTFQIQAVYADGTLSKAVECDAKIDRTAPAITNVEVQSYQSLTQGTMQVTVEENGSGMSGYYISTDATTPTEGSNWIEQNSLTFAIDNIQADTLYYLWVKDKTGNLSEVREFQIPQANYQIDGSDYAATLAQAIEKANDNSTITLLRDYTDESTVNFTKNVTFDTGDYTLTRNATITVNSGKNVTIQGNGKITSGTNAIHTITNSGNLIVKGNVTIESLYTSTSTSSYSAIYNYVSTTVQDNATITGYNGIYNNGTGYIVNVQGGLVKGTGSNGDGIYNGTVTVTGGRIEGNRYGISGASNKITIGDANADISTENPVVYGKQYGVYMYSTSYTFQFNNGKLMADVETTYRGVANVREGYVTYNYYGYEERAHCTILGTEVSEIQIHADPLTWTNQDVSITIYYPTIANMTKQYSLDGTNWINVNDTKVITNVTENTTVYARILNSNQVVVEQAEKVIDYIDKIAPEVTLTPSKTRYYLAEEQSTADIDFTIQVEEQGGSGIYTQQYAWTTGEEEPTYVTFESGIQIAKTLPQGTYYLWLQVKDKAGNTADLTKVPFSVEYQEPVAKIGDTTYTTIQAAVDSCVDGTQTTIIMLKGTDEEVTIPETKNVILDLQGYTVGSYNSVAPVFQNAGILQIIDTSTGKIGTLHHYTGTAINNTGTLTIGDNTSDIENEAPTIQGAKIGIQTTGTFNYYDGSISSRTPINGNITDTPEGYGPVASYENNITIVTLGMVADYEARIEYRYYTTLQNAINACTAKANNTNQQEITIIKDIVLTETAITYKGQNIKLDLDGYTISSSVLLTGIQNKGDLEITDESTEQSGKIEITNNYSGNWERYLTTCAFYNDGEGNIIISGGVVYVDATGSYNSEYGISNSSTGNVEVMRRNCE